MIFWRIITIVVVVGFISCSKEDGKPGPIAEDLRKIEILGADLSEMKAAEDNGVVYKIDNTAKAGLKIHKETGIEWVRLRLFHTPNGIGPVCNSLDYTINFAKQVKANGQKFLLDFHYSNTWADPGHQIVPDVWKDLEINALADSVYNYTKEVLDAMKANNVFPDMIQVGNEINVGMMWPLGKLYESTNPNGWSNFIRLLQAGILACNDAAATNNVEVMIHSAQGSDSESATWFFNKLIDEGIEYDVVGLSYYPYWGGTLSNLKETINNVGTAINKDIIIVEVGFDYAFQSPWQETEASHLQQKTDMEAFFNTIRDNLKVKGVFYWGGSWLQGEKWGAGESRYRSAMFDSNGNALPIFEAFKNESLR